MYSVQYGILYYSWLLLQFWTNTIFLFSIQLMSFHVIKLNDGVEMAKVY